MLMSLLLVVSPALLRAPAPLRETVVASPTVTPHSHSRRTLYHSPQTPGYTCWALVWQALDGSLQATFTEAKGSLTGWRPRAPAEVLRRMPKANQEIPGYDMTGVMLENTFLQSKDGGKKWRRTSAEPFDSCLNGMIGGSVLPLADGSLLRNIWGQGLPFWDVPPTGMLQLSADGGKSWDAPVLLSKDERLQTWPKRMRRLKDGRVIMTGAACTYDRATWTWEAQLRRVRPCMWVSSGPVDTKDRAAETRWIGPLYLAPPEVNFAGEEWDAAELENGDLLAIMRTASWAPDGKLIGQERRQCILAKRGQTWEPGTIVRDPFPHSGMPELLVTREGVILHIAANGIWWTADRGTTWTKLNIPATSYYPCAVQRADGTILVVSHVGSDDPYGKVDQSIVMDTFKLKVKVDPRVSRALNHPRR